MSEQLSVCWGEILWDLFPDGRQLGGAPANVAYHIAALGGECSLVSRVGDDEPGAAAIAALGEVGVTTDLVQVDPARPTGSVNVDVDADGNAIYTLNRGGAWEHIACTADAARAIGGSGALCYGTFCQRNDGARAAVRAALAACPASALRVLDPNLRPKGIDTGVLRDSLEAANVVKINHREAAQIERQLDVDDAIRWLFEDVGARVVALTRGADGSRLMNADGDVHDCPGFEAAPGGDTVGAGDAYTAVLTIGLLRALSIEAINVAACRYGAWVAGQRGATPKVSREVTNQIWE